jgi:hypothetical protein
MEAARQISHWFMGFEEPGFLRVGGINWHQHFLVGNIGGRAEEDHAYLMERPGLSRHTLQRQSTQWGDYLERRTG